MILTGINLLAACTAVLGVWICGVRTLRSQLWGLAVQTALLAGICASLGMSESAGHLLVLALVVLGVKAAAIPYFLAATAKRLGVGRDTGANISPTITMIFGCGALCLGYFLVPEFAVPEMGRPVAAGMALALAFIGMTLMITRRLAISQVVGLLTLENGIFLYSLTQARPLPILVEMGVVFEVLIGVLIAGVFIYRIERSFEHMDVTHMKELRH